jgi:muramoyltetrapeptide carboxypeptidase
VDPAARPWLKPRVLGPGAVLGVVAPAGPVQASRLAAGLRALRAAGFEVVLAPGLLERRGYLAGEDGLRAEGLVALLSDPGVDAVLCARGGYGAMRLLPSCTPELLRRHPKALVGFSDITALHLAWARAGVVSFHGPVVECDPQGMPPPNLAGLVRALTDPAPLGPLPSPPGAPRPRALHPGRARGRLVGGNLSLLCATLGTPWEVQTAGRLLLLEDVGEPAYRLDRYLTQLWLAGKLQAASGFVLGELQGCGRDEEEALAVFAERLTPLGRPILANLPLGHGSVRLTLPLGVQAEVDADRGHLVLLEAGVEAGT